MPLRYRQTSDKIAKKTTSSLLLLVIHAQVGASQALERIAVARPVFFISLLLPRNARQYFNRYILSNPGIAYLVRGSSKTECGPGDVPLFSHTGSPQKQGRLWPAHSLIRIAIVIC